MPPDHKPRRRLSKAGRTPRPTIREVSRLAGVSRMTVSRVIRGLDLVLPETRDRVHKAIADLGYVADRAAGSLSSRRSGFIALMLPTLTNANFAAVAHGLTEALRPADFHLLIAYTNYSTAEEDRQLRSLLERRPEAIVMTGSLHSRAATRMLLAADIPVVEIADLPRRPILHAVGFSNYEAGRSAARHLLQRGFRRLAAVASTSIGDVIDQRGEERMRGFEDAVQQAGLAPPLVLRQGLAPVSYDHGSRMAALVLEQMPRVQAVFAVSDLSAVGIVMECQRRDVQIPRDLSVIGFGDFEIGREINPPLSTIHVDFHVLGQRTGMLIREVLQGNPDGKPQVIDVGLSVLERDSVGIYRP
jgi:LacI family transcriptional regulator, gluconate utilization system Gnt-I transcriptional repressor